MSDLFPEWALEDLKDDIPKIRVFGIPLGDMTNEQLMACVAMSMRQARRLMESNSRTIDMVSDIARARWR